MPAPRVPALRDLASIGVMMTALALPGLGLVLGLDTAPPADEQRTMAQLPALPASWQSVLDFPRRADAYLRDQFGFRNGLLRLHNRVATAWLKRRPSETVEVMVGREGWLYYTGADAIRSIEGRSLLRDDGIRAWKDAVGERGRWLSERGIPYLVVLSPEKGSIYPEHLPDWLRPSTHGTRLDQVVAALQGIEGADVLDLRRALLAAKKEFPWPIYYATDTHWNALGVHVAYREIVGRLGQWFPGASPAPMFSFELTWSNRAGGDLARLLGLEHRYTELAPNLTPRTLRQARHVDAGVYGVGRPGDAVNPPIVTARDQADIPSAVIFRDSFATDLVPFLAEHFERAVFLWTYEFDWEAIDRERPSIVIQEYAERFLYTLAPENPPPVRGALAPVR